MKEGAFVGHKWAAPSVRHLTSLMKYVVAEEGRVEGRKRGMKGREDMVTKFSHGVMANQEMQLIENMVREREESKRKGDDGEL